MHNDEDDHTSDKEPGGPDEGRAARQKTFLRRAVLGATLAAPVVLAAGSAFAEHVDRPHYDHKHVDRPAHNDHTDRLQHFDAPPHHQDEWLHEDKKMNTHLDGTGPGGHGDRNYTRHIDNPRGAHVDHTMPHDDRPNIGHTDHTENYGHIDSPAQNDPHFDKNTTSAGLAQGQNSGLLTASGKKGSTTTGTSLLGGSKTGTTGTTGANGTSLFGGTKTTTVKPKPKPKPSSGLLGGG